MPSYAHLFRGTVRAFTLPEAGASPSIDPPGPYPHAIYCHVNVIRRCTVPGEGELRWRCCCAVSTTETSSDINRSSSDWRDGETHELLTVMGEKAMRSHDALNEDAGAIYEKDAEKLSSRGFCRDKKQVVSEIKNMLAFLHL